VVQLLTPTAWESRSALQAHLDASDRPTLLLGQKAEAPSAYYSFLATSSHGRGDVGLISSGLGSGPAAVFLDQGRRMLVGHDTWLTWVGMEPLTIVSSRRLGGVFYEFLPMERDDEIIILHELGALRVDVNGGVKWTVRTEIVQDWSTEANGNLILSVMDGPPLVVSLSTGAVST
jgi:hypothetical protein